MPEQVPLNDIEKETLALVRYHIKLIQAGIMRGSKDADDPKRLELLDNIVALVHSRATTRREHEKRLADDKAALLKCRQKADCPTCKTVRKVAIVGQTENETFGWSCDVVKCTTCKTRFTNYMPNNWNDRLAFTENMNRKLFSGDPESKKILKQMEAKEILNKQQVLQDFEAFKQSHLEAEASLAKTAAAAEAAEESFEAVYDMLLLAKINNDNLNPGGKYFA